MPSNQDQNSALKLSSFRTTHWSVVTATIKDEEQSRAAALEILCRTYWYPLYAYVCQRGHTPEDAQDLTQEFFAQLLKKDWLAELEPNPQAGRFRCFLLTALNRFLFNEHNRRTAAKRGGGARFICERGNLEFWHSALKKILIFLLKPPFPARGV
ncbi:MAG: hypothetical protein DME23_05590 [Verrucomicrobia bacterium]|nr:MAG: hypothetical protein DME23_05590 [Verrucomicrobiota bacterium]